MLNKKCKKSALGGTFSFFHRGHQFIISEALRVSDEIVIGVTSDDFVKRLKKKHPVEPYEIRALNVLKFCLRNMSSRQKITIFPLEDKYGPTIYDEEIDCIIVSEETFPTAIKINSLRMKRRLKPIRIIKVKMLKDEEGRKISSTLLWRRYTSISSNKIY